METRVTLVSGLFYIGRDRWKHSGFPPNYDRYKDWINNILSLNTNLILFVDEYYYDYVSEVSKKYPSENKKLTLIKTLLSELETYQKYYNKISCVMNAPSFVDFVKTNKVAEMCYPLYNVIMFNKISLIEKAKQNDPFNSTHYYWTDAGAFRDELSKYKNVKWPDKNNETFFNDKIIFFSHFGNDYSINEQKNYFTSQTRVVHGGYFIVPENKIHFLKTEFYKVVDEILSEEYIGSDEKVFDLICKRHPEQVLMIKANWFEFYKLCSKKEKKISLVTVTWSDQDTFNIQDTYLYKSFVNTNQGVDFIHYHFNRNLYQELEKQFQSNFNIQSDYILYKIYLLKDKLKELNTDYIIFADANDVMILGSIKDSIQKFSLEDYIILGREKNQWPSQEARKDWPEYSNYDKYHLENSVFLNSGLILAKKELYINMLENMISDILPLNMKTLGGDQGVFTYYYNSKMTPSIKLDVDSILFLNTYTRNTNECFISDNKLIYKETGIQPCFIHDNGWNYGSPQYIKHFNLLNIKTNRMEIDKERTQIPNRLSGDSTDYHVLSNAAKQIKNIPGAICEIGTRRGGSTKYIIDALIENGDFNRNIVCIDPYGNIEYKATDNYTLRANYDNKMKFETMASLHEYIIDKPINLVAFILEDIEFFKRFSDGVPFYNNYKQIVNQYALVFFDGPHDSTAIKIEIEFFNERSTKGTMWVFDDISTSYPHDEIIEKWLFENNWELIEKTDKKASYKKL